MSEQECEKCGKPRENGVETHHLGCPSALRAQTSRAATRESECLKDGCEEPRAVSKGPRPAKFCEQHKTRSK